MLSREGREARQRLWHKQAVTRLVDRVGALQRPTEAMVATAYQMTDVARGDLLSLALRELPLDAVGQRNLEPLGLADQCANITVEGLDLAGALLRWRFWTGPRSPWSLDGQARRSCSDGCGRVFSSPHQVGRCSICLATRAVSRL